MAIYLKQFSTHSEYEQYINGSDAILPNVSICTTEGDVHYNPYVDPCKSEKVETTYEWVEIGGVKWATKNVGAKTITDYGQYFSWGGVNGFTADQVSGDCHSKAFSWADYELCSGAGTSSSAMTKYNSTDGKTVLESVDDAATANMGSGWRMPTAAEFQALGNAVNAVWTTNYQGSGVNGLVCTDKTDSSKVLFFPAASFCSDGRLVSSSSGNYWSSSLRSSRVLEAHKLYFDVGSVSWQFPYSRRYGLSVRGVFVG